MKQFTSLACLLLMTSIFLSCHKSDMQHESDYDKSFQRWLSFKETSGNTYQYNVIGSTWVGYSWQTTITVSKGKVIQRHFTLAGRDSTYVLPQQVEWIENEGEIGIHTQTGAADPLTLDQVYEKAKTDWLRKRKNVVTYFEAKNNGMLSSCGYTSNGCVDDCFVGINISAIRFMMN